jgi:hypothetical protein
MRLVVTLTTLCMNTRDVLLEEFAITVRTTPKADTVKSVFHSSTVIPMRTFKVRTCANVSDRRLFFTKSKNRNKLFYPTACDCDPRGSMDDGICDSVTDLENGIDAGACHCKSNVKGRRCDNCKEGFWNFDEKTPEGCQQCTCNTMGTVNNSGCNVYTGECTCKRLVTGRDCNQCMPETYGLSEGRDGCNPCNCDAGGSMDNNCDVITGQCR